MATTTSTPRPWNGKGRPTVGTRIDRDDVARLDELAQARGCGRGDLVRAAVLEFLEREGAATA